MLAHGKQRTAIRGQKSEVSLPCDLSAVALAKEEALAKQGGQKSEISSLPDWMAAYLADFTRALDDDLNISLALAALFDFVHAGNKRLDEGALSPVEAVQALDTLEHIDRVLGVHSGEALAPPAAVVQLAQARLESRRRKDWAEADRLRREVEAQGWIIQDAPDGFRVKRKGAA